MDYLILISLIIIICLLGYFIKKNFKNSHIYTLEELSYVYRELLEELKKVSELECTNRNRMTELKRKSEEIKKLKEKIEMLQRVD